MTYSQQQAIIGHLELIAYNWASRIRLNKGVNSIAIMQFNVQLRLRPNERTIFKEMFTGKSSSASESSKKYNCNNAACVEYLCSRFPEQL